MAARHAHDREPLASNPPDAKREHDGNTTRTDARLREQMTTSRGPCDCGVDQHVCRSTPTAADEPRSTHNPKAVGSNPTPAPTKALVDRKIRQGFLASGPECLTVSLTGLADRC